MIPTSVTGGVRTFQTSVAGSKPLSTLTPLQLAALVTQGRALVDTIDAALATVGATLDAPDPAGHPLAMIAALQARVTAAGDQATLSDLRGYVGRAVLNLSQGIA